MLKVIHFVESDLLKLIKDNEVSLPPCVNFKPKDTFVIDTETNTALAEVVGVLNHNRYVLHIREVQKKLFMPFLFCVFAEFSTALLNITITI